MMAPATVSLVSGGGRPNLEQELGSRLAVATELPRQPGMADCFATVAVKVSNGINRTPPDVLLLIALTRMPIINGRNS